MRSEEFHSVSELEELSNGFARASRHPLHADLSTEYDDRDPAGLDDADGTIPMNDTHVIWNNREDRRAYIGSQRYNLVQHREVVDAIREAVDRTVGGIEKGVVRDYGEHVNGTLVFSNQEGARIDVGELVGDGYVPPEGSDWTRDRLGLGMRFHNSFDGRSGFGGSTMGYRFICANWMVWGEQEIAERSSYHIKGDDEGVGIDPDYFVEVIDAVFERKERVESVVKTAVEDGEVPLSWTPGLLEGAGFGKNYSRNIVHRLLDMEQTREDHTTMWHLYNAATAHVDHDRGPSLGPERYDHHQENAWAMLVEEPEAPEEEVEELEEFAKAP
jgi:hypothetical protein